MFEAPQSFAVREECEKAAWQNGFRRARGERDGWSAFESTTVPGSIYLAAGGPGGPWFLAVSHAGAIEELAIPAAGIDGPGIGRYAFDSLGALYSTLSRVYQLSASLPDAPLRLFEQRVKTLPRTTEIERLVVQRVGQDIFRAGLMEYWEGRCPLTGITEPALLRASHIVPWAACSSDSERLDVHNGVLLSALWDAAFDRGLVSFDDAGEPMFSPQLSGAARRELRWHQAIKLTDGHRWQLVRHRAEVFGKLSNDSSDQR